MASGGWYGTQEDWEAAERPLPTLDAKFVEYAKLHDFKLSRNYKDWPERSLKRQMPLSSLIQTYRTDLEHDAWRVWVVCSEDRGDQRFWKRDFVAKDITSDHLSKSLVTLLDRALSLLVAWNKHPDQLEFATKIARLP